MSTTEATSTHVHYQRDANADVLAYSKSSYSGYGPAKVGPYCKPDGTDDDPSILSLKRVIGLERRCFVPRPTTDEAIVKVLDHRAREKAVDCLNRALPHLVERDRRLAYELAAGVLRRRAELDRTLSLETVDPRLHDVLRLGAYQLRALTRVPTYAAVSTSVELAREIAGEGGARYVNQALRKLAKTASGEGGAGPSHPEWLLARWRHYFGIDETARLVAWNDARPALTLQPVRWTSDVLRARLTAAGFGVREAPMQAGLQITAGGTAPRSPLPARLPGFEEGAFIVQDPGPRPCAVAPAPAGSPELLGAGV